jgi:hypothetical protein
MRLFRALSQAETAYLSEETDPLSLLVGQCPLSHPRLF